MGLLRALGVGERPLQGVELHLHAHFKLLREIGRGSYSRVFKVQRLSDGERYALKLTETAGLGYADQRAVLEEARLLASLHHPCVVEYFEAFVDHHRLCVVMEYVRGADLAAVLRDVKPQNLLLGDDGVLRIGDLGISQEMARVFCRTNYMAPEMWRDEPYSYSADVWALGCVVHEMCTLRPLFLSESTKTEEDVKQLVLAGRVPVLPGRYSAALRQLVSVLLHLHAAHRPTIDEVLAMPAVQAQMGCLPAALRASLARAAAADAAVLTNHRDSLEPLAEPIPLLARGGGGGTGGTTSGDLFTDLLNAYLPPARYEKGEGVADALRLQVGAESWCSQQRGACCVEVARGCRVCAAPRPLVSAFGPRACDASARSLPLLGRQSRRCRSTGDLVRLNAEAQGQGSRGDVSRRGGGGGTSGASSAAAPGTPPLPSAAGDMRHSSSVAAFGPGLAGLPFQLPPSSGDAGSALGAHHRRGSCPDLAGRHSVAVGRHSVAVGQVYYLRAQERDKAGGGGARGGGPVPVLRHSVAVGAVGLHHVVLSERQRDSEYRQRHELPEARPFERAPFQFLGGGGGASGRGGSVAPPAVAVAALLPAPGPGAAAATSAQSVAAAAVTPPPCVAGAAVGASRFCDSGGSGSATEQKGKKKRGKLWRIFHHGQQAPAADGGSMHQPCHGSERTAMTTEQPGPSGAQARPAADFSGMRVQEMMKLYYSWLFPHQEMYKWLAYGHDSKHPQADPGFFQRREFCFTLDGDIFVRYQWVPLLLDFRLSKSGRGARARGQSRAPRHVLPEQGLLTDAAQQEAVLAHLPGEELRDRVRRRWAAAGAAGPGLDERRWALLCSEVEEEKQCRGLDRAVKEIVFAWTYPRLDVEVSKKMNHLLKAPFCVHPKTGKVCVPIDPAAAWEFDPDAVATVARLLSQLNASGRQAGGGASGEEWRATDMAEAVATFRACFLDALAAESRAGLAAKAREAAAAPTLACVTAMGGNFGIAQPSQDGVASEGYLPVRWDPDRAARRDPAPVGRSRAAPAPPEEHARAVNLAIRMEMQLWPGVQARREGWGAEFAGLPPPAEVDKLTGDAARLVDRGLAPGAAGRRRFTHVKPVLLPGRPAGGGFGLLPLVEHCQARWAGWLFRLVAGAGEAPWEAVAAELLEREQPGLTPLGLLAWAREPAVVARLPQPLRRWCEGARALPAVQLLAPAPQAPAQAEGGAVGGEAAAAAAAEAVAPPGWQAALPVLWSPLVPGADGHPYLAATHGELRDYGVRTLADLLAFYRQVYALPGAPGGPPGGRAAWRGAAEPLPGYPTAMGFFGAASGEPWREALAWLDAAVVTLPPDILAAAPAAAPAALPGAAEVEAFPIVLDPLELVSGRGRAWQ
eukprot:scaffold7.g3610.t1